MPANVRPGDQGVFGMTALSRKNEPEPATRLRPPYASVLDLIGETPIVELTQIRHRPLPPVHQAREPEPRRLDQGSHRAVDDRRCRALRAADAGRHHRRGDRRQHRARPGAGRHPQGLQHRAGRARQDVAREDPASARARRRGPHDPLGRRQGPSRILPGHGGKASPPKSPARSTSTSSPIPPIRSRTRPPPARRSGSSSARMSTRSWSASARAAR